MEETRLPHKQIFMGAVVFLINGGSTFTELLFNVATAVDAHLS